MSELEKAIRNEELLPGRGSSHDAILAAARRLLNLTSPETIEKAGRWLNTFTGGHPDEWDDPVIREDFTFHAKQLLRSVEEGNQ